MLINLRILLRRIFDKYFRYGYNLGNQGFTKSNISLSWMGWSNYNRGEEGYIYGIAEFRKRTGKESKWD